MRLRGQGWLHPRDVRAQPGVGRPQDGHWSPLAPPGERGAGSHQAGWPWGSPSAAWTRHTQRSRHWARLPGCGRGDPGAWTKRAGDGAGGWPLGVPKLAPGGRRAQWGRAVGMRSGSRVPASRRGSSETPTHPDQTAVQGSQVPTRRGACPQGAPFPRLHRPPAAPREGTRGGACSPAETSSLGPQEARPHPRRPRPGHRRLSWGPSRDPLPGAGWGLSRPPRLPLARCPLGDLIGGGRKAQAGGPEGGGLARSRPEAPGHASRDAVGRSRVCGAAATRGSRLGDGWVCRVCLCVQVWACGSVVRACRGRCLGGGRAGPPRPSLSSERKLRRNV